VGFEEVGSDEELTNAYLDNQVADRWARAESLLSQAKALLADSAEQRRQAEEAGREALAAFASALNWAEDRPLESEAHERMDAAGRWVRETFGCHLPQDGSNYSQTCPVALGHNRIGLSVGGAATRTCSLCGEDLSECPHLRGRAYRVPGGAGDLGWCRVCVAHGTCEHSDQELYTAGVVAIISEMELQEVSLVSKPAHPDARLSSVGISTDDLQSALGPAWTPGVPVNCDRCLTACDGLIRHDMIHG
jgi:hypothetical protein